MTNSCHAEQLTLTCHAELVSACITNLVSLTDAGIHISLTLSCSLALNGSAVRSLPPLRPLLAHAVLFARSKRVCGAELSAPPPSARSRFSFFEFIMDSSGIINLILSCRINKIRTKLKSYQNT